jgi:2-methylisocitrate lyase-like PEP mutase family enzyme
VTTKTLRLRLREPRPLLAPGVYDALTALLAEQAGFEVVYLSGASVAYSRLGRGDVGLVTASEMVDVLARISDRIALPVIADADTGYGNAVNVQHTVRDFERAGAAMVQLEDQLFPKRCGHLDGKALIGCEEMCGKLRAALDARRSTETLILARTDAVAVEGFDAALRRAEAYLACGVDGLFVEGLRSADQLREAGRAFGGRTCLIANMVEGGATPLQELDALAGMGYRVVLYPGGTARAVGHALQGYFAALLREGSTASWRGRMLDFGGLNEVLGTPGLLADARRYGDCERSR